MSLSNTTPISNITNIPLKIPSPIKIKDAISSMENALDNTSYIIYNDNNEINIFINQYDILNINTFPNQKISLYYDNFLYDDIKIYDNFNKNEIITKNNNYPNTFQQVRDHTDAIGPDGTIVFFQNISNYKYDINYNIHKSFVYNSTFTHFINNLFFDYNNNNTKYNIVNKNITLKKQLNIINNVNQTNHQFDNEYPVLLDMTNQQNKNITLLPDKLTFYTDEPSQHLSVINKYLPCHLVIPDNVKIFKNLYGIEWGIEYIFNEEKQINQLDCILFYCIQHPYLFNANEVSYFNEPIKITGYDYGTPQFVIKNKNQYIEINAYGFQESTKEQTLMGTLNSHERLYYDLKKELLLSPLKISKFKLIISTNLLNKFKKTPESIINTTDFFPLYPQLGLCAKFIPQYNPKLTNINNLLTYDTFYNSKNFNNFKKHNCTLQNSLNMYKHNKNKNKNTQLLDNINITEDATALYFNADINNNISSPLIEISENSISEASIKLLTFNYNDNTTITDYTILQDYNLNNNIIDIIIPKDILDINSTYLNINLKYNADINNILYNLSLNNCYYQEVNNYLENSTNKQINKIYQLKTLNFNNNSSKELTLTSDGYTNNFSFHKNTSSFNITPNEDIIGKSIIIKALQIYNDNIVNTYYYNTDAVSFQNKLDSTTTNYNILDYAKTVDIITIDKKTIYFPNIDTTNTDYIIVYITRIDYDYNNTINKTKDSSQSNLVMFEYTIKYNSILYKTINSITDFHNIIQDKNIFQYEIWYL